jgi:rubrerythrin
MKEERKMKKSIKGTKTEKNLLTAFAGESQARNRYTYFASAAKKEGYEQISRIFTETAENEKEHAKIFFKFLEGGDVEIMAAYPAGVIGNTLANLEAAAAGEYEEWANIYVSFAKTAKEEGFDNIALAFTNIAVAEQFHEGRYRALSKNIAAQKVFRKDTGIKWHCLNCGYVHEGNGAPEECPACSHPLAYFEVLAENY